MRGCWLLEASCWFSTYKEVSQLAQMILWNNEACCWILASSINALHPALFLSKCPVLAGWTRPDFQVISIVCLNFHAVYRPLSLEQTSTTWQRPLKFSELFASPRYQLIIRQSTTSLQPTPGAACIVSTALLLPQWVSAHRFAGVVQHYWSVLMHSQNQYTSWYICQRKLHPLSLSLLTPRALRTSVLGCCCMNQ